MKIDNQQALSVEPKSLLNVESHDQKVTPISEGNSLEENLMLTLSRNFLFQMN